MIRPVPFAEACRRTHLGFAFTTIVLVLAVALCSIGPLIAAADTTDPKAIGRSPSQGGKRIALVIGNKDYQDVPLRNPVNDAEDLSGLLKRLGFSVTTKANVDLREFDEAVDRFSREITGAEVALFYFSGHGCQARGENFLIPVGNVINDESDLRYKAMNAGLVLDKMEQAKAGINIVILDACRNNPFKGFRSGSRGLTALQASSGSFIAYATAPGKVAADGRDRNSVYTKHLLRAIESRGLDILLAFQKVAAEVNRETNGGQIPWFSSALMGPFSFNPMVASVAPQPIPRRPVAQQRASEPPPGFSEEAGRLWMLAWKGDPEAQNKLGILYEKGSEVPRDDAKAVEWYRKAADQGNAEAEKNLGMMYEHGFGVSKNYSEAAKWYRKAAEKGHSTGQNSLGDMYWNGRGVPEDRAQALKWYEKAAAQGNGTACYNLGLAYKYGQGVKTDRAEAAKWFKQGAYRGHEDAKKELQRWY